MNRYELYVLDEEGKLHPTGIWTRGHKMEHVEDHFKKPLRKIGKPCAILVTTLIPGVNDK